MTTFPQTEAAAEHGEQSKNQAPAVDLFGSNDTWIRDGKCESFGAQPLRVQTES